ncbi:MAG: DUF4388 domain-containing protein [Candidatus Fermentibacteraceae bacterium]|nr:DUF4388 domain-containing protein [Candidatus Fermentibacteraceae bacterium]
MAISGTLSDIGFVSLLQFPNSSRKTGLLTVISIDGKAEFFYRKGELVHARYGQKKGRDVLVDIVDWSEGQFSFEAGLEPDETSIQEDLHHILMWALKERDEKKQNGRKGQAGMLVEIDEELSVKLDGLLGTVSDIEYICMMTQEGRLLARSRADEGFLKILDPLMGSITGFISEYPGGLAGKAFFEGESVSIAMAGLDPEKTVMIATGPEMKLGRLSMVLGRITRELGGE